MSDDKITISDAIHSIIAGLENIINIITQCQKQTQSDFVNADAVKLYLETPLKKALDLYNYINNIK